MEALDDLLTATLDDINNYNDSIETVKTKRCFESIPSQLRGTKKKFTFSRVYDRTKERLDLSTKQKYYDNTEWLGAAGYGIFCYLLTRPSIPLKANKVVDQCRTYPFDTGMLVRMYGPAARIAIFGEDYRYNQGAVTENVVAECLMKAVYLRLRDDLKPECMTLEEVDYTVMSDAEGDSFE